MKTAHFLIPDITTSQDLSAAALNYTTTLDKAFKLEQIQFRFSQAVTETITITLDSAKGASYDIVLRVKDLVAEQNYVFRPEGEDNYQKGDQIKIQCTNANGVGTIYGKLKTSEM